MDFHYTISGDDYNQAGHASSEMKKKLKQLGIPPLLVKRTAVAMYEAEINMVVHAGGGVADISIDDKEITIIMSDKGPGIPNVELAMTEGWSTASKAAQELGFGAGMGLSNMKKNSDFIDIKTKIGLGTTVTMKIFLDKLSMVK
ncbi:MAG: anti-sigma regulatory factor [Treponema sp. CETP13]|nr:MAG: anti-sigma regulatory factor [Treponema sp. CETP13]